MNLAHPCYPLLPATVVCGTPGYVAPEVIQKRGHSHPCDNWSLGILIFELITGDNPFYFQGMDQITLFRSIVQDKVPLPLDKSAAVRDLIEKLLVKDPVYRLGSLALGERQIIEHTWFSLIDQKKYARRKVKAPWVPSLNGLLDTSNFEDWSRLQDATKQSFDALRPSKAKLFDDF
jgi:serine/threonine protein kinase